MRSKLFILPVLALLASVSSASAAVYKCNMTTTAAGFGFLSPEIYFDFSQNNTEGRVLDRLVQHVYGEPIAASVKSVRKNVYRIRWEVKNVPTRGRTDVNMNFSAHLDLNSKKLNLLGYLPSNNQEATGRGRCALDQ